MNRRRFITGAASLLTAPALVRASSLDYVPRGEVLEVLTHKPDFMLVPSQLWVVVVDENGNISDPQHWPT